MNRLRALAWFSPLAVGILSCAALNFLPSTEMRLWPVRGMFVYAVVTALLLQIVLVAVLLFRRAWPKALLSSAAVGMLLLATVFAALIGGSVPDSVARKTADATGVQREHLVCLGGSLARESVVLFRLDGALSPSPEFEPIPDSSDIRGMVTRMLERFGQSSGDLPSCRILKRNQGVNTILAIETPAGWYLVYYGNAVF